MKAHIGSKMAGAAPLHMCQLTSAEVTHPGTSDQSNGGSSTSPSHEKCFFAGKQHGLPTARKKKAGEAKKAHQNGVAAVVISFFILVVVATRIWSS